MAIFRVLIVGLLASVVTMPAHGSPGRLDPHVQVQTSAVVVPASSKWNYRGVSIVPARRTDFTSPGFRASVREAQDDGANTIDLVLQYYQKGLTGSHVYPAPSLPQLADIANAAKFIRSHGMQVAMKVFVDVQPKGDKHGPWRARIVPKNKDRWFSDLTRIEAGLARLQPDVLIIGTEMIRVASDRFDASNGARWRKLIKAVREGYHGKRNQYRGKLTYETQTPNGNRTEEVQNISFWPKLDFITVGAYNALGESSPDGTCSDPTIDNLMQKWSEIWSRAYAPLFARFHKKIMLGEAGYSSYSCDYLTPFQYWGLQKDPVYDPQEQAQDFEAMLSFFGNEPGLLGALIWNWQPDAQVAGSPFDLDFTPQNKPAEAVLRSFFNRASPPVDIWWPISTHTYTHTIPDSTQTFQAALADMSPGDYLMYWSVSGGQLNAMSDGFSDVGDPEKRAEVDLSGWTWNEDHHYPVTFTATTRNGHILGSSTVDIYIGD